MAEKSCMRDEFIISRLERFVSPFKMNTIALSEHDPSFYNHSTIKTVTKYKSLWVSKS